MSGNVQASSATGTIAPASERALVSRGHHSLSSSDFNVNRWSSARRGMRQASASTDVDSFVTTASVSHDNRASTISTGSQSKTGRRRGKRGGRTRGAEGYTDQDQLALIRCIRQLQPIGGNDWVRVLELYHTSYANRYGRAPRDVASIKNKYKSLLNCKKPSGDPECPVTVRQARAVQSQIAALAHFAELDDGLSEHEESQDHPSRTLSTTTAAESWSPGYRNDDDNMLLTQQSVVSLAQQSPASSTVVESCAPFCPPSRQPHSQHQMQLRSQSSQESQKQLQGQMLLASPASRSTASSQSVAHGQSQEQERPTPNLIHPPANPTAQPHRTPAPRPLTSTVRPGGQQMGNLGKRQRQQRSTLVGRVTEHLENVTTAREATAAERYLQLQLTVEKEAKMFERAERRDLNTKLRRLEKASDKKIAKLKEQVVTLREKAEGLREKNMALQMQLARYLPPAMPSPFAQPSSHSAASQCDSSHQFPQPMIRPERDPSHPPMDLLGNTALDLRV